MREWTDSWCARSSQNHAGTSWIDTEHRRVERQQGCWNCFVSEKAQGSNNCCRSEETAAEMGRSKCQTYKRTTDSTCLCSFWLLSLSLRNIEVRKTSLNYPNGQKTTLMMQTTTTVTNDWKQVTVGRQQIPHNDHRHEKRNQSHFTRTKSLR